MKRRSLFKALALAAALAVGFNAGAQQKTVKVGILHRSRDDGHQRDGAEGRGADGDRGDQRQGRRDGLQDRGRGGRSRLQLAALRREGAPALTQDKVAVVFGCWTSVSRKSVLPVFEELNGLLFYPVQYEGEELSKNVFYTGAAPNQQAIPAVEYLMSKDGGGAKRFVLLGTDYVYPRTTNKILRAFLKSKGVQDKDIDEKYTPFGHSDYQTIVST
jgi:urea transport system substrate-binding protein